MKKFLLTILCVCCLCSYAFANAQTGVFVNIGAGLTALAGSGSAWGDLDNDGRLDIVSGGRPSYTNPLNLIFVYKQLANGSFEVIAQPPEEQGGLVSGVDAKIIWIDYNKDGYMDLSIISRKNMEDPWKMRLYQNMNGNGIFEKKAEFLSRQVSWGDFDNDGFPDFISTWADSNGAIKLFRNIDGTGDFQEYTVVIPSYLGLNQVSFIDYDNDGKLDIFSTSPKFYHNDGPGTGYQWLFSPVTIILSGVLSPLALNLGEYAWGDYDNDGYADLLFSGKGAGIYRNAGPVGSQWELKRTVDLTSVYGEATMGNLHAYGAAWGDYDNDADLDFIVMGYDSVTGKAKTRVYENKGSASGWQFTSIYAGISDVYLGSVAWGDYNNDGYLDVLLTGRTNAGCDTAETAVYRNTLGNSLLAVNLPPQVPLNPGLQNIVNGSDVTLKWSKFNDARTPVNGLYYDVYVGNGANPVASVSPLSHVSDNAPTLKGMNSILKGQRLAPVFGELSQDTTWTIKNLPNGTYAWGVQAVDTGFLGSLYVTGSFYVGPGYIISGRIMNGSKPIGGVQLLDCQTSMSPFPVVATTDLNGYYSFKKPAGWSGMIKPLKKPWIFFPQARNYSNINKDQLDQNYKPYSGRPEPISINVD